MRTEAGARTFLRRPPSTFRPLTGRDLGRHLNAVSATSLDSQRTTEEDASDEPHSAPRLELNYLNHRCFSSVYCQTTKQTPVFSFCFIDVWDPPNIKSQIHPIIGSTLAHQEPIKGLGTSQTSGPPASSSSVNSCSESRSPQPSADASPSSETADSSPHTNVSRRQRSFAGAETYSQSGCPLVAA